MVIVYLVECKYEYQEAFFVDTKNACITWKVIVNQVERNYNYQEVYFCLYKKDMAIHTKNAPFVYTVQIISQVGDYLVI